MTTAYQGILFPDRAESLQQFKDYKVFLDHWSPLAAELRVFYEGLAIRGETRCLAIFGRQGSGKTLFAQKLRDDFHAARATAAQGAISVEQNNLWHRITSGGVNSSDLTSRATVNTELLHIEDDPGWVEKAVSWKASHPTRYCVIIADNAERPYFRKSLLSLTDAEYLQLGSMPEATKMAAQKLVALARRELRGCLFVALTNDGEFLKGFDDAVQGQHAGLLKTTEIPLPGSRDKETVVRVNTNRLNPISYWFCLDKAGPTEKQQVYSSLKGASTFPESFDAVNRAVSQAEASRIGRPAKKNTLTLAVLHSGLDLPPQLLESIGEIERTDVSHQWLSVATYRSGWARKCLTDEREAKLLESEWQLRIVTLGNPFVASLLSGNPEHQDACRNVLDVMEQVHGPGTHAGTRASYRVSCQEAVGRWPDTSTLDTNAFWAKGQSRSHDYESRLRSLISGYNTGGEGFLMFRPDYIIEAFRPCSILEAASEEIEYINGVIRRNAHVCEFVAITTPDLAAITAYLQTKLPNYVTITQEQ